MERQLKLTTRRYQTFILSPIHLEMTPWRQQRQETSKISRKTTREEREEGGGDVESYGKSLLKSSNDRVHCSRNEGITWQRSFLRMFQIFSSSYIFGSAVSPTADSFPSKSIDGTARIISYYLKPLPGFKPTSVIVAPPQGTFVRTLYRPSYPGRSWW